MTCPRCLLFSVLYSSLLPRTPCYVSPQRNAPRARSSQPPRDIADVCEFAIASPRRSTLDVRASRLARERTAGARAGSACWREWSRREACTARGMSDPRAKPSSSRRRLDPKLDALARRSAALARRSRGSRSRVSSSAGRAHVPSALRDTRRAPRLLRRAGGEQPHGCCDSVSAAAQATLPQCSKA
jgi:hypothetical protein